MCDYPFFIPQVVLFANSSLFWFKVTNEHREFRNYLQFSISLPYFEIVTKFLRLLCNCMILLSCNNVNIFVAYFLRNYKIYSLLFITFLVIIVHLRIK